MLKGGQRVAPSSPCGRTDTTGRCPHGRCSPRFRQNTYGMHLYLPMIISQSPNVQITCIFCDGMVPCVEGDRDGGDAGGAAVEGVGGGLTPSLARSA